VPSWYLTFSSVFVNGRSRPVIMDDMRSRIDRGDIKLERAEAIKVYSSETRFKLCKLIQMATRQCVILQQTVQLNSNTLKYAPIFQSVHDHALTVQFCGCQYHACVPFRTAIINNEFECYSMMSMMSLFHYKPLVALLDPSRSSSDPNKVALSLPLLPQHLYDALLRRCGRWRIRQVPS
jgi:hypothetical protein